MIRFPAGRRKGLSNILNFHRVPSNNGLLQLARQDFSEPAFVEDAARGVIEVLCPEYIIPENTFFRLLKVGEAFAVDTNVDFNAINKIYHQRIPVTHSTVTPAYVLAHLVNARVDAYFAAEYMAEIVPSPANSYVIGKNIPI